MWAKAIAKNDAATAVSFMQEIFDKHGNAKQVLTDNGKNFTSISIEYFVTHRGIKHLFTTAYHSQANGLNEKANGTLVQKVKLNLLAAGKWSSSVADTCHHYNNTVHSVTGYTPSLVFNGCDSHNSQSKSTTEMETIRADVTKSDKFKQRKKIEFNKHRHTLLCFINSLVNRRIPDNLSSRNKLSASFDGPYRILAQTSPVNFDIKNETTGNILKVHVSQIEPYFERRFYT
ncbi:Retrovirus-related Pol polyprotein from transposon-like protein [Leptotrombidium deliense]|uniref:Retrovirus-related Pol polyprotein from transposon-like protein n=1 Tax=Leptotrombidium deliense TaxID=299467 RepID=A0A443S3H8_9ACAR|nr:Retrovirus-related Pol polyprotein from transposon-like protein [Leptotrombidium deliense]